MDSNRSWNRIYLEGIKNVAHDNVISLLCLSIGYRIYQKRKTYRLIDRLLDSVLNREMIAASDVEEGEYSALVSKIKQIQEVLGKHANRVEQEKEQVKSLVSNMSHQLKTPLANISLYAEILSKEEITLERKKVFSEKVQRQVDKLSWIVESLFEDGKVGAKY